MITKIKKYILNPYKIFAFLGAKGYLKWIPDRAYLKLFYRGHTNEKLDLKNPKTFGGKLQVLKLTDRNSLYTNLVDKYLVRDYVRKYIGNAFLIPIYGIFNNANDINFADLPESFVIKCTHDSGGVFIIKNKREVNEDKIKLELKILLSRNFYYVGREWPYKNVKPRIIVEKLMIEKNTINESLVDYKFYCFNGTPEYCQVITGRGKNETIDFFDMNWNHMPFVGMRKLPNYDGIIEKPNELDTLIKFSKKLSKQITFVRVDFYLINNEIFFGELTFFPTSGLGRIVPNSWDLKLGEQIEL